MTATGHSHAGHTHPPTGRGRLLATFVTTAVVMFAEAGGGWVTGSLALWADAGHMLFDLLALGVALGAQWVAQRPADGRRTYGYRRLEVLAALVNSMALVGIAVAIGFEAWERWATPAPVLVGPMMAVAGVGLVANLLSLWLLGGHHHHDLNVRGAFLHILGDTLSSVGVIIGGVIILATGWNRIDAVLSCVIACIIVVGSINLLREVVDVLLESAPQGVDTAAVRAALTDVAGVEQVHDLHIWSITVGMPALSAHIVVASPSDDPYSLRRTLQQTLQTRFGIEHATLQMEASLSEGCGCT
jgi:cobalt-zinc-cadmium efflux system protein